MLCVINLHITLGGSPQAPLHDTFSDGFFRGFYGVNVLAYERPPVNEFVWSNADTDAGKL